MEENKRDTCFKTVPVPGRKSYQIPDAVARILEDAVHLTSDHFEILCLELIKKGKLDKPQFVKIKNLIIQEERRARKTVPDASKSTAMSGQPSTVDPSAESQLPALPAPVTQVPLIVRMDLAASADVLALDTEKIIDKTHQNLSGDVAVVDLKGNLVYWAYINRPRDSVCRLNTSQTGLTFKKLEIGISDDLMKTTLSMVIQGKTVVGAKPKDDFISLGFPKKSSLPQGVKLCELQEFFIDENDDPIRLSQLAIHFIGSNPQEGTHSSLRDARITMICYRRMLAFKETGMTKYTCDVFKKFRQEQKDEKKNKKKVYWEPCRCGLTTKGKKKQNLNKLCVFGNVNVADFDDVI